MFRKPRRGQEVIVNSGQHYDYNMSHSFLMSSYPKPRYNLDEVIVTSKSSWLNHDRFEPILDAENPDMVLVYGDTNITLAAAIAAAKQNYPLAYVEAGLRSYRKGMSEEINRVLADRISDYLFCSSLHAYKTWQSENIKNKIYGWRRNVRCL